VTDWAAHDRRREQARGPFERLCQLSAPVLVWAKASYRCEGQRHREGGAAHSAATPGGLIIWWEYGNGRIAKVLRPVTPG
jgi:hypothetical protein